MTVGDLPVNVNPDLPGALKGVLLGLLLISAAVWLGGWVTLVLVARSTTATLQRHDRVAFFTHFGRRFGIVAAVALIVALVTGGVLLAAATWTLVSSVLAVAAAVLVAVLAVGVAQARRMTRLRRTAIAAPDDHALAARVTAGARRASVLRAGIGAISLLIFVLAIVQAAQPA